MKQKTKIVTIIIVSFIALYYLVFLVQAISFFWVGFHNVDLAFNMDRIEQYTNCSFLDIGSDNVLRDSQELYQLGTSQTLKAHRLILGLAITSSVFFLSALSLLGVLWGKNNHSPLSYRYGRRKGSRANSADA